MGNNQHTAPEHQEKNRTLTLLAVLVILVIIGTGFSLFAGSVRIPLSKILAGSLAETEQAVLVHLRLPRTIGCVFAGGALALSGLIIQSVLANPLAAPNIIGIHSGAGLMTTIACALFPNVFNLVPAASFAGALMASQLVLFLARKVQASKTTLLLAGLAISSIFSALSDLVITFWPDALIGYTGFRMGSLSGVSMERILPGLMAIILAMMISTLCAPELEVLSMGENQATMIGLNSKRWTQIFLVLSSLLAGGTISFCGLIGFIGLIVPQIIRKLFANESSFRILMIANVLTGAFLLLMADFLGRVLFAPFEISCGILLSLAGGPYFLFLLLKSRRRSLFSQKKSKTKNDRKALHDH